MALPVFRAATAKQTASGSNAVTVPNPSGIQAGDLDILVAINTAEAGAPSISAGGSNYVNFVPGGFNWVAGGRVFVAWYRIYQATDTNPDVIDGGANGVHAMRFCIQKDTFSRASPLEMITEGSEATVDASMSWAVGASTSGPERLIYAIYTISRDSNTASTPVCTNTSLTSLASRYNACTNVGGGGGFGITEGARATAGSAGTFECTYATTSAKVFFAFAVKPEYPATIVPNTADAYNFGTDTTPTLEFTGSDANADDLSYEVQIATDGNFYSGVGDYLDSQMGFTAYTALLTNNVHVGQAFNAQGGGQLSAARFYMQKIGSATGSMYAELYAASGVFPNVTAMGSALAVSNSYDASNVSASGGIIPFTFSGGNQYQLQPNTNYVIFVYHGSGDASNYVQAAYNPNNPHYGNYVAGAEGSWGTEPTRDAWFAVSTIHGVTLTLDKLSASHAGFLNTVNGADTDPFTAGDKISFTVQEADALASGTWYWRARVKDPGGLNAWSGWTATRSFTISGGITGNLSQTLDAATASGVAVVETHATATPTLSELTSTTEVDVAIISALDQSLDALTATIDVDAIAGASLDQSLDILTLAADATVAATPITGDLDITLDAAALTADATLPVIGNATVALDAATCAGAAAVEIIAATDAALDAATVSATTAAVATGNLAVELGAATLSADATTASPPITADLSVTLDALTVQGAAATAIVASTATALDAATISADADAISGASLTQSLDAVTFDSSGVVEVGASTDAVLGAVAATSDADVALVANANITLGGLGIVADASTGYADINASLNVALDALTAASGAAVKVAAATDASLGALSLAVIGGPVVAGVTSQALGALGLAATAGPIVSGVTSQTLGGITFVSTATASIAGTTSATLGAAALASESDVSVTGGLSAALADATLNSTASTTARIIADLDATLGQLGIASACAVRVTTATAYVLGELSGLATGAVIVGARTVAVLGAASGAGTGTLTITASGDLNLGALQRSISVSVSVSGDLDSLLDPVAGAVYVMPPINWHSPAVSTLRVTRGASTLRATQARSTLKAIPKQATVEET